MSSGIHLFPFNSIRKDKIKIRYTLFISAEKFRMKMKKKKKKKKKKKMKKLVAFALRAEGSKSDSKEDHYCVSAQSHRAGYDLTASVWVNTVADKNKSTCAAGLRLECGLFSQP